MDGPSGLPRIRIMFVPGAPWGRKVYAEGAREIVRITNNDYPASRKYDPAPKETSPEVHPG